MAQQSPVASGWLGVSGLSAPATATIKQTSNLISQMSLASDYPGGEGSEVTAPTEMVG